MLDFTDPYAFALEPGEDVLLQSSVTLKNQPGTLSLTTQRIVFCRFSSAEPTISIPLYQIANHFVSSAKSQQVLLKVMTDEDEKNQSETATENEDAKKRNRKKKVFGSIFEFSSTSGSAVSERDGFRDLIAQLVPLHRKMHMEEVAALSGKGKEKVVEEKEKEKEKEKETEKRDIATTNGYYGQPAKRRRLDVYVFINTINELLIFHTHLSDLGAPSDEMISINEAKQRAALLAGNPELKNLHEKLVLTGVITETEFWESRKVK